MGAHQITAVQAFRDAVDRLEWKVRVATDFYGTRPTLVFAIAWVGRVAFSRQPIASNSMPGLEFPKMTLPARWMNPERCARMVTPQPSHFEFSTELPIEALDRVEQFRESGRLYARIEGKLTVVIAEQNAPASWLTGLSCLMGDVQRSPHADVWTESLELTRDTWCADILGVLRPPGRHIVEIQVPTAGVASDLANRILSYLTEAQRAFDEGRAGEVARVCYRALDDLNRYITETEGRYGTFGRDRLLDQVKTAKSLCNPDRHGQLAANDGLRADRQMAQHILATTQSIAGVALAAP